MKAMHTTSRVLIETDFNETIDLIYILRIALQELDNGRYGNYPKDKIAKWRSFISEIANEGKKGAEEYDKLVFMDD